ncbi:TPA: hypothetical protein ACPJ03_004445, partial [Vibrio diabolicus]
NAFEFSTTNIVNMAAVTIKLIRLTSTIWCANATNLIYNIQSHRKPCRKTKNAPKRQINRQESHFNCQLGTIAYSVHSKERL